MGSEVRLSSNQGSHMHKLHYLGQREKCRSYKKLMKEHYPNRQLGFHVFSDMLRFYYEWLSIQLLF